VIDKEHLTAHIQDRDVKQNVIKALDKIEGVLKNHDIRTTDFLNPYEQHEVQAGLNHFSDLNYRLEGGYQGAERQVITIFHEYLPPGEVPFGIDLLKVRNKSSFNTLGHRDYLGGILGLGIKREKIGDLLVHEDYAHVIVAKEISEYLVFHLEKVANAPVEVSHDRLSNLSLPEQQGKTVVGSVASLRLDGILALGFKLSRKEAQEAVGKGLAKINHRPVMKTAEEVELKDQISVKGYGRLTVMELGKTTRSGRIKVTLIRQ